MDFSHIVASGGDPVEFVSRFGTRISHVHIRDAVPGNINLSVGNGAVDFATASRRSPTPVSPGISRWNSKPATSPTTNDPPPQPRPDS